MSPQVMAVFEQTGLADAERLHDKQRNGEQGDDAYGYPNEYLSHQIRLIRAHDALISRNDRHEAQKHGQNDAVDELRHDHDGEQVDIRHENDQRGKQNDEGEDALEDRRLFPGKRHARFPAKCLADDEGRGER